MALILSLETATKVCSVALHQLNNPIANGLIALSEYQGDYSHSEKLNEFIMEVLQKADKKFEDLEAVAVSKGPGSYTGLRIGVSTAKGLCYALDIPLISVDTLLSMALKAAEEVEDETAIFCPMIDARRMEVYCAFYDAQQQLLTPISAEIIDEHSFESWNKRKVYFFGDGAEKCRATLKAKSNFFYLDQITPSAKELGRLAMQKMQNNEFEDVAYFEPFYLKDFIGTKAKKLL